MNIKELLEKPYTVTAENIEALRSDLDAKQSATLESCKVYMDDVSTQDGRIKAQAEKYAAELAKLETLEKRQGEAVAQAVAKGDSCSAGKAEAELDKTVAKIAATKKKLALMTGAAAKGEPALFAKAKADMDATDTAAEEYRESLETLKASLLQEAERLKQLSENIGSKLNVGFYGTGRRDFAASARYAFDKVYRHYNDLDRKEAEAKQKQEEKRKAEEAARIRRANTFVIT